MDGGWAANRWGMFVAMLFGGARSCLVGGRSHANKSLAWLNEAVRFRAAGKDELLLDASGHTLARLVPAPRSETPPTVAEPPELRAKELSNLRRELLADARLPAGLRAATRQELVGRWVPANPAQDHRGQEAYLLLSADGSWTGSDGCNGYYGRWEAGDGGRLVVVSGGSTLIGCDNVPVGGWLETARRAGFHGRVLVLVDPYGHVTGRLRRP